MPLDVTVFLSSGKHVHCKEPIYTRRWREVREVAAASGTMLGVDDTTSHERQ